MSSERSGARVVVSRAQKSAARAMTSRAAITGREVSVSVRKIADAEPAECSHLNVRTFRSIPPRSECQDCGAVVERRWIATLPVSLHDERGA